MAARAPTSSKGRILLLEDDPTFNEIIRTFLTGEGYEVVAVTGGADGIREVVAGEFRMILCDLNMPALPGDTFYEAVERVRPGMGKRFVFMTGYRGDGRTNDFIRRINGFVLQKPFTMENLLNSIAIAEVRGECVSVFEEGGDDGSAQLPPPVDPYMKRLVSYHPPPASGVRRPVPAGNPAAVAGQPPERRAPEAVPPATGPGPAETAARPAPGVWEAVMAWIDGNERFLDILVPAVAVLAVLAVNLVFRVPAARYLATAAAAERSGLAKEWQRVAADLDVAQSARTAGAPLRERFIRLARERNGADLAPVLQAVARITAPGVTVQGVTVRAAGGPGADATIVIQGLATGPGREDAMNAAFATLQKETQRIPGRPVNSRLERLGARSSAGVDERFRITLTVGAADDRTILTGGGR